MKTVSTAKGTLLPLLNLKGKDYLMVGYRLQWFNEMETNFEINTEFLLLTDEQTIVKATVSVRDPKSNFVTKKATATKRETKKDFSDHTEKAETSAIGRALAMMGYGTQFALSDLDEGTRLADSPLEDVKKNTKTATEAAKMAPNVTLINNETKKVATLNQVLSDGGSLPKKVSSFRKFTKEVASGGGSVSNVSTNTNVSTMVATLTNGATTESEWES